MCYGFGQNTWSKNRLCGVKHAALSEIWKKKKYIFYELHFCLLENTEQIFCTCLFTASPTKVADRQGYLLDSLPSCFTAADFIMVLNPLDYFLVPPKKELYCFFFFFRHPNEKGLVINWLEDQLFSPRGQLGFIALHMKLMEGLFCVRVTFTADGMYWSCHKAK